MKKTLHLMFIMVAAITTFVLVESSSSLAREQTKSTSVAQSQNLAAVDINTADQKTIESLPGIGPALAKAIIAGRPYKSVDELNRIKGISKAKLQAIKDKVTVGSAAALSPRVAIPTGAPGTAIEKASSAKKDVGKISTKAAAKLLPGQHININTATKAELEALPGIGPVKAQSIIDGRPYQKPEDIMKVKGIKQKTFDQIKNYLIVK